LSDGKEIFSYSGIISDNKIILPSNASLSLNDKVFLSIFNFSSLRKAATRIVSTVSDQIINTGVLTFSGTTITKVADVIFTATNTGMKLNLSEAVRKSLSLLSTSQIPSNIRLARIVKLEKVTTA